MTEFAKIFPSDQISPNTIILQDQSAGRAAWLCFKDPIVIKTECLEKVKQCLVDIQSHVDQGSYAAGFFSYDISPALDNAFKTHQASQVPLLWFGIYRDYEIIDQLPDEQNDYGHFEEWASSVGQNDYNDAIASIKSRICAGDTYQVNYTVRLRNQFHGNSWSLFLQLQRPQQASYSAYHHIDRLRICSVSPELFFLLKDEKIICKPMKGPAKRGLNCIEDDEQARWLKSSEKDRAENVMIVDMIRNDLGTIADAGTVKVEKLFSIDRYPTVHQVTSTVTARTSVRALEIIRKMFTCASITGAPKIKTMEIIKELEPDARGLYTGSIGYIAPNGTAQFNVAIRTVVINTAEYGVGSGIVLDSNAQSEYEECKTKAAVLTHQIPSLAPIHLINPKIATSQFESASCSTETGCAKCHMIT